MQEEGAREDEVFDRNEWRIVATPDGNIRKTEKKKKKSESQRYCVLLAMTQPTSTKGSQALFSEMLYHSPIK